MTSRKFGVEIEIVGISQQRAAKVLRLVGINVNRESYNHTTRNAWKIVSDASVRNGFEVVSPPLSGEAGIEEVSRVVTALDDAGASINRTCGLHVHFDAAGLDAAAIKNIILRYAKYEREIDGFMPPSRRGNNNTYCKSIVSLAGHRNFRSASNMQQILRVFACRYYKLNVQSYVRPRHH